MHVTIAIAAAEAAAAAATAIEIATAATVTGTAMCGATHRETHGATDVRAVRTGPIPRRAVPKASRPRSVIRLGGHGRTRRERTSRRAPNKRRARIRRHETINSRAPTNRGVAASRVPPMPAAASARAMSAAGEVGVGAAAGGVTVGKTPATGPGPTRHQAKDRRQAR